MSVQEQLKLIADAIEQASSIAICSHISPDGDTIGSGNALRMGLEQLGKHVAWFDQDACPKYLQVIPGWETLRQPESLTEEEHFDLLLCEDISDPARMGSCDVLMSRCTHSVQIDHHATNPCDWTELSAVDGHGSACAVLAYDLLKLLKVQITPDMANSLYAALASDTGSFAYAITPEAFEMMADLVRLGVDVPLMHRLLFEVREVPVVKLSGCALCSLHFSEDGTVTTMRTTNEDYAACGATYANADPLVNQGLRIEGVRATALLKDTVNADGEPIIKVSFRAIRPYDISVVAAMYGGGGHAQASGATIVGKDMDTAAREIEEALLKVVHE